MQKVLLVVGILLLIGILVLFYNRTGKGKKYQMAPSIAYATHLTGKQPQSAHFDWRERGMQFAVPDQGECGACWAHGALIPFQKRRSGIPPLSTQYMLRCQAYCSNPFVCDDGCEGGRVDHSWAFLREHGVPAASDYSGQSACDLPKETKVYKASDIYRVPARRELIKEEIAARGPVSAGMSAYECFSDFAGARVYKREAGRRSIGGHVVVLIGWDDAKQAWLALNVWGTHWGDAGFAWIGYGECGIEDDVVAGV